jgi:hypothetical protein
VGKLGYYELDKGGVLVAHARFLVGHFEDVGFWSCREISCCRTGKISRFKVLSRVAAT